MDLTKTKLYLDKLHREFSRLNKDPENIARIDVDIMASYVRELYDALLSDAAPKNESPSHTPPPRKTTHNRPSEPEIRASPPNSPWQPPAEEAPPSAPPPVVEEKPAPPPTPAKTHSSHHHHTDAESLFEEKQAKELADKLSEQPIADLKKAIALNDRLLLTRELFAGDGKAFEATLHALNGYSDFSDAKSYLLDHCVTRYLWLDKKRVEDAKKFIKLVRRRYK